MVRTMILTSLLALGFGGCASNQAAAPKNDPAAVAAKPAQANEDEDQANVEPNRKKSIFESQTKEDVEQLNHVDKSLYEVSGELHPDK